MAFVHDIEADRIDDFNVFSAFVRVPLLILGGVLGGGEKSKSSSSSKENEDLDGSTSTLATHPMKDDGHCDDDEDHDAMDCSSSSTTRLDNEDSNGSSPQHPNSRIVSNTDIDETDTDAEGLKRSKKMSWSDSQGLRLVEYNDESLPRKPHHATQKPKSVMKKCNGERDPAAVKPSAANDPKRYIPKMGGASINMPSFSHGGGASPGYVSPEWGWYINTTPPTPEMYHSQSSFGPSSKLTRTDASGAPTFPFASQNAAAKTSSAKPHHNQVFQNLQSNMTQNMGWTSVPI
ncbi:MAG: hypothetical protein SGILL_006866 [Bacillariaceae sp.]